MPQSQTPCFSWRCIRALIRYKIFRILTGADAVMLREGVEGISAEWALGASHIYAPPGRVMTGRALHYSIGSLRLGNTLVRISGFQFMAAEIDWAWLICYFYYSGRYGAVIAKSGDIAAFCL